MVLPKIKLHQLFFYLLILFLPTQLGKHFWPDWTMVLGLRLDYLSPTVYFTDLLILGILISWFLDKLKSKKYNVKFTTTNIKKYFLLSTFYFLLFLNCFFAQNQPAALYKLLKLAEFAALGIYIIKNSFSFTAFYLLLSTSIVYSSLLAIVQFLKQGSIGGIFYWLGERSFTAGTPGIAQTIWNGRLLLRSYATFPHPNVLAGFLVISLLLILMKNRQINTAVVICPLILGVIALFLTFSHVAWVVLGGAITFKVLLFERSENFSFRSKNIFFVLLLFLGFLVFLFFSFPIQSESITYRQDLNLAAIKMWESSPLFGVGLNNFLVRLPEFYQSHGEIRWFQPAHNVFLLVVAETGLIGLICLIWLIVLTFRRLLLTTNYLLLTALAVILILGLFDHYFYTLQQGQLLMTLVFGLAWSTPSKNDKITS